MFVKDFLEQIGEDPQFLICLEGAYYVQNGRNGIWIGDGGQLTPERMVNIAWNTNALCFIFLKDDKLFLYSYLASAPENYNIEEILRVWPRFVNYLYKKFIPNNNRILDTFYEFTQLIKKCSGALLSKRIDELNEINSQHPLEINGWKLHADFVLMSLIGGASILQHNQDCVLPKGLSITPIYISKLLADEVVRNLRLEDKNKLTIFDPVCGTGTLLSVIMCQLRKSGFKGIITVIGWDVDGDVVNLAKSILGRGKFGEVNMELEVHNSLLEDWPMCDILVMDPPSKSWISMTGVERRLLLSLWKEHGDFSAAFAQKLLNMSLQPRVVAVILPTNLIVCPEYQQWRVSLSNVLDVNLLMKLDDIDISRQTSSMTMMIGTSSVERNVSAVDIAWKENSERLDALIYAYKQYKKQGGRTSNIYSVDRHWLQSGVWPLWSNTEFAQRLQIESMLHSGRMLRMKDVFDIDAGINAHIMNYYCISEVEFAKLPKSIKKYYRPIITDFSIRLGHIVRTSYIFSPFDEAGELAIQTEADFAYKLPDLYKTLSNKKLNSIFPDVWWVCPGLERQITSLNKSKLVVARHSRLGETAFDAVGGYISGDGFNLFLKSRYADNFFYYVFLAMMNAHAYRTILRWYNVYSRGLANFKKIDLEQIPIPNVFECSDDSILNTLVEIGMSIETHTPFDRDALEKIVKGFYE